MNMTGTRKFWRLLRESAGKKSVKRKIEYGETIRLFDCDGNEYCPLTFVDAKSRNVYKNEEEILDIGNWGGAASQLGMDKEYALDIVDAADNPLEYLHGRPRRIRQKLLKTLKLREPKSD